MGDRQIRSCSWSRTPKRCSADGIMDEFIVIDDDEVIILDFPESSKCKASRTSRTGNDSILQRVISIDDDEDDKDADREDVRKHKSSVKGDECVGDSSRNSPVTNLQTSAEVDSDDCQLIQEKCATFRFSKCKQTFSTKAFSGTRLGLGSDSETDFTESDCSDCEVLEGSNRAVREQWEKAFMRKKRKAGKRVFDEEVSPSDLPYDTNIRPDVGSGTSFFPPARNSDRGKENSSTFFASSDRNLDTPLFDSEMKEDSPAKNCATSSFCSKEDFQRPSSLSPEIQVEHARSDSPSANCTFSKEPIHQNNLKEVDELPDEMQVQSEMLDSPLHRKNGKKKAANQFCSKEVEEESGSKSSSPQTSDENGDSRTTLLGSQSIGGRYEHGISGLTDLTEPVIDSIPSTSGQVQSLHGTAPVIDTMLNREKLKETDEYKKAQEEEWESRQRQLRVQAEEAQRQRKRRKLEINRKLEVERRQKERIEEVRETQKKDEESMNIKEQVRAEITKSLKQLETVSFNMASLLRGLGVHVVGGTSPPPHEVHAAYKRAVLKFHPDRTSRGDIRQQVEAEEKFKLISRMKDKFLSSAFR